MLTTIDKAKIVDEYKKSASDTGCPEVQIALKTARIVYLTEHFKKHKQDQHSRRGLMCLVSSRRKLLDYLNAKDHSRYKEIITKLNIRK